MDRANFTELLNTYFGQSRFSQAELARQLGKKDRSTVNKWLSGENLPSSEDLVKLAIIFQLNEDKAKEFFKAAGKGDSLKVLKSFIGSFTTHSEITQDQNQTTTSDSVLQLPQPSPHFVGRQTEIELTLEFLQPGHIVTLVGPGGMGKTQIALMVAQRLSPHHEAPQIFPDGIIFYSFYGKGKGSVEDALLHIINSFHKKAVIEPGQSLDEIVLDTLSTRRVLVILDGAEFVDNFKRITDVRGKNCAILITSQRRQDIIEKVIEVNSLSLAEAEMLISKFVENYTNVSKAVQQLYVLVDGVTLAIEIVGAFLREQQETIDEYLGWLKKCYLDALDFGKHRRESMKIVIERTISHLKPETLQILAVMGILAFEPVDYIVLVTALNISEYELKHPLRELVNFSLLIKEGKQCRVRHVILYNYIKQYLPVSLEIVSRLANFYTHLNIQKKDSATTVKLSNQEEHVISIIKVCIDQLNWEWVLKLAMFTSSCKSKFKKWVTVAQYGLEAAQALEQKDAEMTLLSTLGYHYLKSLTYNNQIALKYFQKAVSVASNLRDVERELEYLHVLGDIFNLRNQSKMAIEYYQNALKIACNQENFLVTLSRQIELEGRIGDLYRDLDEHEIAINHYNQQLLLINQEILLEKQDDDFPYTLDITDTMQYSWSHTQRSICVLKIGMAYKWQGKLEKTIEYYKQELQNSDCHNKVFCNYSGTT